MATQTMTPTAKVAQVNEGDIQRTKIAAAQAKRYYMTCRASKEEAAMAAFVRSRDALMLACGGANTRFQREWADVMEGR